MTRCIVNLVVMLGIVEFRTSWQTAQPEYRITGLAVCVDSEHCLEADKSLCSSRLDELLSHLRLLQVLVLLVIHDGFGDHQTGIR